VACQNSQDLPARVAACAGNSDGKRHFSTLMRVNGQSAGGGDAA
jgi:hypothetical protein